MISFEEEHTKLLIEFLKKRKENGNNNSTRVGKSLLVIHNYSIENEIVTHYDTET